MGLRDWVSEKVQDREAGWSTPASFNGAPRLGLGEGRGSCWQRRHRCRASMGLRDWVSEKGTGRQGRGRRGGRLQWGSETGSRRRPSSGRRDRVTRRASMGLRDWVSEKARAELVTSHRSPRASMGLRDWVSEKVASIALKNERKFKLQWGSETGSRRRLPARSRWCSVPLASMGLRDWVSEKGGHLPPARRGRGASMGLRDWVSEKARRWRHRQGLRPVASMGLRDWVSEKGAKRGNRQGDGRGFNGAPRLGLGEGRPCCTTCSGSAASLQWGSETGSRRRGRAVFGRSAPNDSFNGAPRLGLGEGLRNELLSFGIAAASMGLRDWVSEKGDPR